MGGRGKGTLCGDWVNTHGICMKDYVQMASGCYFPSSQPGDKSTIFFYEDNAKTQ